MIISDSSIGMDSVRTYTSVSTDAYIRSRSVTTMSAKDFLASLNGAIQNKDVSDSENEDKTKKTDKEKKDADTLSGNAENSLEYLKGKFNELSTSKVARSSKVEDDLRSAIRYMCLNFLLMLLLGKNGGSEGEDLFLKAFGISPKAGGMSSFGQNDLSSLSFTEITDKVSYKHYEAERECTSFNAKGIVRTSDGRELDFNIEMSMSRSFERYTKEIGSYNSLQVNLMDPLIINFDTCAAAVSDQKFFFDLNSDGKLDEMSRLSAGSGFLALDINEDGKINDGSELFGTKSGDGFKDLAKYDKDGNGWIDEADDVFDKLRIFCIDEDGNEIQYKLKDKGVGAIYLGNKETEFSVTNQENRINAQVRKTGLFLYESGSAGTIQHVDMAVELGA